MNHNPQIKVDLKNNTTRYYTVNGVILAFAAFFLGLFAFFSFQVVSVNQQIDDARFQRDKLYQEISYFKVARDLATEDVETYNSMLLQLIPEIEDYFSIIASLERLSIYTGIDISRYSISLADANSDKFALSILGTVPPELFQTFLDNYQYGTGRLVTIESISYTTSEQNNVRLTLNLYSRKVTTSNLVRVGSLSREDMDLMTEVQSKMRLGEQRAVEVQELRQQLEQQKAIKELERQRIESTKSATQR